MDAHGAAGWGGKLHVHHSRHGVDDLACGESRELERPEICEVESRRCVGLWGPGYCSMRGLCDP
eukprot:1966595-Prymnesium_polylepis.1